MSESRALTPMQKRSIALQQFLRSPGTVERMVSILPKHMTADRMCRLALMAATRNPKLAECVETDKGKTSILIAILNAGQLGIEINGRDGHLVPFQNRRGNYMECVFIPDYKGLIQLAYQSGVVESIEAHAVYERDLFQYQFGSDSFVKHVPSDEDNPGELKYAYACFRMKGGGSGFVVLNKRQVMNRKSSSKKSGEDSIWQQHPEAMWAKSAVRELAKWMPQLPGLDKFAKAVEYEAQQDASGAARIIDGEAVPFSDPDDDEEQPQKSKAERTAEALRDSKKPKPDSEEPKQADIRKHIKAAIDKAFMDPPLQRDAALKKLMDEIEDPDNPACSQEDLDWAKGYISELKKKG